MGASPPSPKRETNTERNARMAAADKNSVNTRALRLKDEYLKRSRQRPPVFGGPETGASMLGSMGGSQLGVMG